MKELRKKRNIATAIKTGRRWLSNKKEINYE